MQCSFAPLPTALQEENNDGKGIDEQNDTPATGQHNIAKSTDKSAGANRGDVELKKNGESIE